MDSTCVRSKYIHLKYIEGYAQLYTYDFYYYINVKRSNHSLQRGRIGSNAGIGSHVQALGSNHSPQRGRISSNAVIGSHDIISLVG